MADALGRAKASGLRGKRKGKGKEKGKAGARTQAGAGEREGGRERERGEVGRVNGTWEKERQREREREREQEPARENQKCFSSDRTRLDPTAVVLATHEQKNPRKTD